MIHGGCGGGEIYYRIDLAYDFAGIVAYRRPAGTFSDKRKAIGAYGLMAFCFGTAGKLHPIGREHRPRHFNAHSARTAHYGNFLHIDHLIPPFYEMTAKGLLKNLAYLT
jgi:hypothetical protein